MTTKSSVVNAIVGKLRNSIPELEGIYLFGSQVTGQLLPDSDWDFGFLSRQSLEQTELWDLKTTLEVELDIDIDLLDLYKADTILQIQVLKTGELVWKGDEYAVQTFEYLTTSYYQKLNEERAGILDDIKERGYILSREGGQTD